MKSALAHAIFQALVHYGGSSHPLKNRGDQSNGGCHVHVHSLESMTEGQDQECLKPAELVGGARRLLHEAGRSQQPIGQPENVAESALIGAG